MNQPDRTQQKIRVFLKDGTLLKTLDWKECVQRPAGTESVSVPVNDARTKAIPDIGAKMADGSVFAGLTADGTHRIYAMPNDLDVCMSFNDAAKAVTKLNNNKALGHDDWQIPSLEHLRVLYEHANEGALKGTFDTSGNKGSSSGHPDWYWSSTDLRDYPSSVHNVRFSDGGVGWLQKGNVRLSCRPVRLVAASSVPAPGRRRSII